MGESYSEHAVVTAHPELPAHRVVWRSRLTMLLIVVLGTIAVSYRIARFQVGRSYEDMNSGNALLQKSDYEASIAMFDRALERNGNLTLAWTGKGLSFLFLGRYDEALKQYARALDINPAFQVAWYGCGISLVKLGRYDDALACFDHVIELYPDDLYARRLRSRVIRMMRHGDRLQSVV